jgi:predicted transcriptional regulator of viral defense system
MSNQEHAVARLAARQHGVVAFPQLKALGFTKYAVHRRVRTGRLHALYRGVYAVGHRALTTKGRWLAAVLACGPSAVLSHRTALALWALRPVSAGPIDVTVLRSGGRGQPGICLHCVRALRAKDRTILDAIPVTSVARTLLDYAQTASPQQLRAALQSAER